MYKRILILAVYICLSSFGLYKLKMHDTWIDFAVGFGMYGLGFLIWLYILRTTPLSVAFPIASGGLMIATQLIGYFLLKERFSSLQIIGAGLILLGIVLVYSQIGGIKSE